MKILVRTLGPSHHPSLPLHTLSYSFILFVISNIPYWDSTLVTSHCGWAITVYFLLTVLYLSLDLLVFAMPSLGTAPPNNNQETNRLLWTCHHHRPSLHFTLGFMYRRVIKFGDGENWMGEKLNGWWLLLFEELKLQMIPGISSAFLYYNTKRIILIYRLSCLLFNVLERWAWKRSMIVRLFSEKFLHLFPYHWPQSITEKGK